MILNFISIPTLIISFIIGLVIVVFFNPENKIRYIYPPPNVKKKFYIKDNANNCFQYLSEEVNCPKNKNKIMDFPIQK